ncbi:MAG: hypothetical protein JWO02_1908 [Solirubrobacterales bacterium]|nr:hypothetical protein [Solirubrobacterales bacterium]
MSDADRPTLSPVPDAPNAVRVKPRLKRLRLLALLVPLGGLAVVSTVFGMMMAVASDLPALENEPQYRGQGGKNSTLYDSRGRPIGRLASDTNRIFVQYPEISGYMRSAIIAVEDERFLTNSGVDLRGIARAFTEDILKGGAVQGGSTITQQFVKNALQAQDKRTVFQKLRESALAYHLTRKWSKQKILTEYLNSIYFGNGAYGIEAAAETYFGQDINHAPNGDSPGCGTEKRPCAKELQVHEAALLAAIVASPAGYDPVAHPRAALARRNLVLQKMRDQKAITPGQYAKALAEPLPPPEAVRPPQLDSKAPYFTTWVRNQLVEQYGARKAFEGGLKVRTTLDLDMQKYAQNAVDRWMGNDPNGPTAALVAIDNDTGEVRAMVSGSQDYGTRPFNLATQGQRQPGSSFKPFILAQALREGIGPGSVWASKKQTFCVVRTKKGCKEPFPVNNFQDTYTGQRTLANALTYSDNSVFATVGIHVGTRKVATLARQMGIRTPVSHNLAMTLGGLKEGVTPLDMAHAYETFATGGLRMHGSLGAADQGPVGIRWIVDSKGKKTTNERLRRRVLSKAVAQTASQVMSTVVSQGTAKRAQIGQFAAGKTGTTENYGDAWFVGFTDKLTVAVWVGYPDKLVSMKTNFEGGPVEGGTFPALIWHDFMAPSVALLAQRSAKERADKGLAPVGPTTGTDPAGATGTATVPPGTTGTVPPEGATGAPAGGTGAPQTSATQTTPKALATPAPTPNPAPTPTPTPTPTSTPTPAPTNEGGTGGAAPSGGAAPPAP